MGIEAVSTGPLPNPITDQPITVVGSGRCVWDDLYALPEEIILTVNDMVAYYPGKVSHAFSNDHRQLPHWVEGRRRAYTQKWGKDIKLHTLMKSSAPGMTMWPFPGHGSSGLNATYVALSLTTGHVTLAGIPIDDSGHFYDPPWIKTNFTNEAPDRNWVFARDNVFDGRVTSLSGRSKDLLS